MLPPTVAAASADSGTATSSTRDGVNGTADQASTLRTVLEFGSEGPLVAAAQQRLNETLPLLATLAVDGIASARLTRGAVADFQLRCTT